MRLSAGTLLSQTGTHLPMVSCEVLGEGRNKGAKRLCDNEGAPRRAFKCGTQAARDKLCQSPRNYFFVQSRGLVWAFMEGCKDTSRHVSLSLACNIELTWGSLQTKCIVNHLLFYCGETEKKKLNQLFMTDTNQRSECSSSPHTYICSIIKSVILLNKFLKDWGEW